MIDPTQQQQQAADQSVQQKQQYDSKKASQRAFAASGPDDPPPGSGAADREALIKHVSSAPVMHKGGVVSADGRNSEYRKVYLSRKQSKRG